jgi:hypothetical protein
VSGLFRRAVARLTEGDDEVADRALREGLAPAGATPVANCCKGEPVRVAGTLRAVTLRPLAGIPTLEAELYDGTGSIRLVWLGRRKIGGIECGRSLVAHGRLTMHDGKPPLYNAEYELRPAVV